jgi:hypothetical protein
VDFLAIDGDVRRSRDAETHLAAAETNHSYDDIARNTHGFIGPATEDQHCFALLKADGSTLAFPRQALSMP